jgi:Zn-dependent peptidase ImmA (M78 family)
MSRKIDIETKKRYALLTLKWCETYFGLCLRKKRKLLFKFSERKRKIENCDVFGNYCFYRNEIIIYLPNNHTIYDVVSTVIHEYTHYLQVRRKYREFEKTRYYSQNPMERQAKRNEDKYTNTCLKEIKKLL